jgi:hypothetical protein
MVTWGDGSRTAAPTLVLVAPHFGHPGHLGAVRTERFQRWAVEDGFRVSVVRAGSRDACERRPWGPVVTVRDPLGFYRGAAESGGVPSKPRKPSPLRRALAYRALVPDPLVVWGWRVLRSRLVRTLEDRVDWVLSSSPPESSHVLAQRLAARWRADHLVDMRDGWLDEPMIPLLDTSQVQRWRHRRLERRVLAGARTILVTSEHWRRMLLRRCALVPERVAVVTNAYPTDFPPVDEGRRDPRRRLRLLYAGKVYSSRPERSVADLMKPLVEGCARCPVRGRVEFYGNLLDCEAAEILEYRTPLAENGWKTEVRPPLPRPALLERLVEADGLLVLSASVASIPAKLFDALPAKRPILAVAPSTSAVADVASGVDHVHLHHLGEPAGAAIQAFFDDCVRGEPVRHIPPAYSEAAVRSAFLKALAF